jgi:enoyl-CoA hydratase
VKDTTAVITIDDGKANALSADVIAAVHNALDEADNEAVRAIVIAGRAGMLSGGFDLKVMRGGDFDEMVRLVTSGGDLVLRLYQSPRPIVIAVTGHAVAAGALLALGSHYRVGAAGDFRIGLIETAIGMVLPDWAVEMATERLDPSQLQQATIEARVYNPVEACEAGFLDKVADDVMAVALEEAARLGALDAAAYAGTAAKVRGPGCARLAAALDRDRR